MSCNSKINVSRKVACPLTPSASPSLLLSYVMPSKLTQIFAPMWHTHTHRHRGRKKREQKVLLNVGSGDNCASSTFVTRTKHLRKTRQAKRNTKNWRKKLREKEKEGEREWGNWNGMEINKETSTSSQIVALAARIWGQRAEGSAARQEQSRTGYSCRHLEQL